jgi:hypothetical protein
MSNVDTVDWEYIAPGFEVASFDYTEQLPKELKEQTAKNLDSGDFLSATDDKTSERRSVTHFTLGDYYYVVIALTHNNTGVWVTHNDVFRYQINL